MRAERSLMLMLAWWLWCSLVPVQCLEPLSAGLAVGGGMVLSAVWSARDQVLCQFRECCGSPWITPNLAPLEDSLEANVFGQHLVTRLVTRAVRAHVRKSEPKKALVMSFHGWTGSGKNFVAKFIVESLFKLGLNSKFVHLLISTLHFPNKDMADIYKLRVQDWIRGNVTECQSSVFIFDEIDKMPEGMIDGIKPFIDHHHTVEGQNFRKSIFIFLSNTGGKQITEQTYQFWKEGRQREEITYTDLEKLVNQGAFNELGGLHQSSVIGSSLIDVYVPFLPLERRHVKLCVEKEARERNLSLTDTVLTNILDSLTYWPADPGLFSTSGCKRVANRLDLYQEELEEERDELVIMPMLKKQEKFHNWYKAFIQMMMSKGMMKGEEVYSGVKSICDTFKDFRDFPKMDTKDPEDVADMIDEMMEAANKNLEPLRLRISKILEEANSGSQESPKYSQYYVLSPDPAFDNEQLAKLQKHYGEPELEWLKLVATHLVENTEEKVENQTKLINLTLEGGNNSSKRKMTVLEAGSALEMFTEAGYLMKVKQGARNQSVKYGLGPRFMVEMEQWLRLTFEEDVWECGKCQKVGMIGVKCPKRSCAQQYHLYCVAKKDPKCLVCHTPIKLEGVAIKRH